jgi:hypothetical protein
MKQLFTFWGKYVEVPTESRLFIKNNSNTLAFKKDEFYAAEDEYKPFWNFVPEGLVGGHSYDEEGTKTIHWITEACGYFTGSLHLHSDTPCGQAIQFLRRGRIVQIPLEKMRYGQEHDSAINELIHVLKQHKINQQIALLKVLKQPNAEALYFKFMDEMESLGNQLTAQQVMDLLGLKRSTYFNVRKAYLRKRR